MASKDHARRVDYEGLNGETSWILVPDHFTGTVYGDCRISKGSPVEWLHHFLTTTRPLALASTFISIKVASYGVIWKFKIFKRFGYEVRPTGTDASHQNGPVVERAHLSVENAVRAFTRNFGRMLFTIISESRMHLP